MTTDEKPIPDLRVATLKAFLEVVAPGREFRVLNLSTIHHSQMGAKYWPLEFPAIELHCEHVKCSGVRFFHTQAEPRLEPDKDTYHFATFVCRNCHSSAKTFSLRIRLESKDASGAVQKFGEIPPFGPPTPAKLITLVGEERDYFLKGRRAENLGLGIAAFAYYRRVIENQRNRIFDQIVKVASKLNAAQEMIHDLETAKKETQFTKSVEAVKHGIPQTLLIGGHNPLLLLHAALSEGLHAQTDEQCLELATSIRVVLTDFVDRAAAALKEEAELATAVSRLLSAKAITIQPKQ